MADPLALLTLAERAGGDIFKGIWGVFSQKETWRREDTAVQRRVADLRAAGLNPVLAAGSAAQSSSPISFGTMENDAFGQYAQVLKMKQDISRSKSEKALVDQQARSAKADADLKERLLSGKVEEQALDLEVKRETQDSNIMRTMYEASVLAYKVNISRVEAAVAELYGAINADLDTQLKVIRNRIEGEYRLPQEEARLAELIVAAKAAKYNYEYATEKGYPVGNPDMFNRAIQTLVEILGRVFRFDKHHK